MMKQRKYTVTVDDVQRVSKLSRIENRDFGIPTDQPKKKTLRILYRLLLMKLLELSYK